MSAGVYQTVAVGAAVLGLLGCVGAGLALRMLRRLRRATTLLSQGATEESFVQAAARQVATVERLRAEGAALRGQVQTLRTQLDGSVQHVAVVRYDAFTDLGGRLSFSVALLDDRGDGVLLTSISGRSEGRVYAKGVHAGSSEQALSPEERQAMAAALTRRESHSPGRR